jgi:cytidine deaminase
METVLWPGLDINDELWKKSLWAKAKEASEYSYSPYSNYKVGAAVLSIEENGDFKIVPGTNVENASYGLTICAERVALSRAVSEGCKNIKAIAIYTASGGGAPCGACRQFIFEMSPDMDVIYMQHGSLVVNKASWLLPDAWSL